MSAGWMTAAQAAEHLGVTRRALYKRVERGQVPARWWGRHLRFQRSALDALMAPVRAPREEATHQDALGREISPRDVPQRPRASPNSPRRDAVASAPVSATAGKE